MYPLATGLPSEIFAFQTASAAGLWDPSPAAKEGRWPADAGLDGRLGIADLGLSGPTCRPVTLCDTVPVMSQHRRIAAPCTLLASMALLAFVASMAVAQTSRDTFGSFWQSFQAAVRSNDLTKITEMTKFPLPVHGSVDSDQVVRVNQMQAKARVQGWLSQDSGLSERPEKMRDAILRTEAATIRARGPSRGVTEQSVRFGAFLFERQTGRWQLTRVYQEN